MLNSYQKLLSAILTGIIGIANTILVIYIYLTQGTFLLYY